MSKESFSMTPPLTPLESDPEDEELDYINFLNSNKQYHQFEGGEHSSHQDWSHLFDCQGEIHPRNSIGTNSYLGLNMLHNLLHKGEPYEEGTRNLIYSLDVLYGRLSHCLMKARKAALSLERSSQPFFSREVDSLPETKSPFELRKEVVEVFQGISVLIPTLSFEDDKEFLHLVIQEIIEFYKFLGPIHLLPSHVTNASSRNGNKNSSAAYHLLHLHLDVRLWSLSLLYQIERMLDSDIRILWQNQTYFNELKMEPALEDSESGFKIFNWLAHIIVWDILSLMKKQSSKVLLSELTELPSFPCACGYELTVFVLHLTDWRHGNCNQNSTFWSLITKKLLPLLLLEEKMVGEQQCFSSGLNFPPPIFYDIKMYQIWWMFTKIAALFQYDTKGQILTSNSLSVKSEMKMLRTLVKTTVLQNNLNSTHFEETLRFYLRCCLTLQEHWQNEKDGKHSDWVICLWDYFSKVLNSTFTIQGKIEGFATLSKTPSAFIKLIKLLTGNKELEKSEASWMIFLRIVVRVVSTNENEWRILKGRINSRFHSKKMAELSPIGLYNTSLLYLVLANTKDMTLCTKLCDLLSDVPQDCVNKIDAVLHSLTATAYLLISRNCHLECIAEKFEKIICSVCQQCISSADPMRKRNMGRSIIMLCVGFQEVLEISSDLTLGQGILFGSALSSFCSQATIVEQGSILSCLNVALVNVLKATKELHSLADGTGLDILETIWCNFQRYIKSQLRSLTPPSNLGSICSSLVLCASRYHFYSKSSKISEATSLLSYIFDNDVVSGRIALQFLSNFVKEPDSIHYVSKLFEKYDEKMIECLLTSLFEYGSSDEVIVGTEVIFSSPILADIINDPPACPFGAFEMLIQCLSRKFKSSQSFKDRLKVRDKAVVYLMPLEKLLLSMLKKAPFPNHLPQVLELIGCVFSYATPMLYIKGKSTSLIPKLISAVILPSAIYNLEKPLGSVLSDALAPVLPKVIIGLSSLGFSSDSYVARCLKDIFHNYTHRFSFITHPFIQVLSDESTPNANELKLIFIDTLNINFLSKRNCNLAYLQLVISLLLEFLNHHEEQWLQIQCNVMFNPLLELLLYLEDLHTKRIATDFLQKLLLLAEVNNLSDEIVERIRKFTVCHVAWYAGRVFRILDVMSVMSPNIMIECLPGIAEAIKSTEEKRGTGNDQALRKGYYSLMDKLKVTDDKLSM